MSLDYLLLGIIAEAKTENDINKLFEDILQCFWRAECPEIYATLRALEDRELLASKKVSAECGLPRQVYEISPKGIEELCKWLRSAPGHCDEHHPFATQLFLLGYLEDYFLTLSYLSKLECLLRSRLQVMECFEQAWRKCDFEYPNISNAYEFHCQMAMEFALANARASLQSCQESIGRVKSRIQSFSASKGNKESEQA